MDKIKEMGEGIVVQDPPVHKTTKDEVLAKGKRSATNGNAAHIFSGAEYCMLRCVMWLKYLQVDIQIFSLQQG